MATMLTMLVGCSNKGVTNTEKKVNEDATNSTQETKNEMEEITFYGVKDPQISLTQILADQLGYFEEEGLKLKNTYLPNVQDLHILKL